MKLADYFAAAHLTERYHLLSQIFGHPCWISSFRSATFDLVASFFGAHPIRGIDEKKGEACGIRGRVWTSCTLVRLNSTVLAGRLVITQSGRWSLVTSRFPANSTSAVAAGAANPRDFPARKNEILTVYHYLSVLPYCCQRSVSICPFHSKNKKNIRGNVCYDIGTLIFYYWKNVINYLLEYSTQR